jgi:hypothetical protein
VTKKEKLRALQRRADHLKQRISSSGRKLSFDESELAALQWAIGVLTSYCERCEARHPGTCPLLRIASREL